MRVLLVGITCGPDLGSEPGLTWNWAWHLSAHHEVWALTGPRYRDRIERFLGEHPNPNLHFVWVAVPPRWDPWDPGRGDRWVRLHYLLWQRAALREASRLCRLRRFDLVHHVSWTTISAPPGLWRLPVPFVWGPLGGGQTTPRAFRRYLGRAWWSEAVRTARVRALPYLPALRRTARRSALLLATNRETAALLSKAEARDVRLFLDSSPPPGYVPPRPIRRRPASAVTLLWAGRIMPTKALPLGLEAMAQAGDVPVRLVVAGDGPVRAECEALARRLGLDGRVSFRGRVPYARMPELFREADAFLFTSLRDSFGSVVLEAMAHALPVITLDHQGVGAFVPREAAIKVPVRTPAGTIAALAEGMRTLARSAETRLAMGEAAWAWARTETWDRRAESMSRWYEECVRARLRATGPESAKRPA